MKWPRLSDSSKSSRIVTDLNKERLTKRKNEYKYRQRFEVWIMSYKSGTDQRARADRGGFEIQGVQEVDIGR